MTKYDVSVGNNAEQILAVPYPAAPTPSVAEPMNYGSSPYPMPLKPSSRRDDPDQYCNTLGPAPRDQHYNVPYLGPNCPIKEAQPYDRDSCFLMESKAQGTVGIVCNEPGGSDNANFIRGNQFGVDYPFNWDEKMANKKLEYTVERPVQLDMQRNQNPLVAYDSQNFYPYPSFEYEKQKDYLTYQRFPTFDERGIPIYKFPYRVLNPPYGDDKSKEQLYETFAQEEEKQIKKSQSNMFHFVVLLLFVILVIYIFAINRKK